MADGETKAQAWERLMRARGGQVIEYLRKIRNLSNRANYDYEEAHVNIFFDNLAKQVEVSRQEFLKKLNKSK
jgi:hypothetical protein